jgi:outer membrane protein assembly factor BamB
MARCVFRSIRAEFESSPLPSPGKSLMHASSLRSVVLATISAVLALSTSPFAQGLSPLFSFHGHAPGDGLGSAAAELRRISSGASERVVLGAAPSAQDQGYVLCVSSKTGQELWRVDGAAPGELFGKSLATLGDLDGDGLEDVLVGAPGANRAVLLSGSNGSTLASLSAPTHAQLFGLAVTGLPDLDQDGIADYAIGAPEDAKQAAQTGAIFLYSGKTSTLLRRIEAPEQGMQFGWSICDMGDWNGDGIADLGVGAPRTWNYNYLHWGMGAVLVVSTQDGAVLFRHDTKDLWANEGEFVTALGDVDGDGRQELGGAARREDYHSEKRLWGVAAVHFSQGGGSSTVSASRILAERIARVGDLDGDGFDDWLFGQPRAAFAGLDAGAVRIYSSKSGRLLHTGAGLVGTGAGDHRGETVLGLGDLDGDGRREWLVSSPGSDAAFADAGRVEIHSGRLRYPKHAGFFSTQVSYSQYKTPFCELDDIDFDGTPDFAYARDAQHIDVLSGSSLKVLWTHTVQIAGTLPTKPDLHLARIEDVDGDRFADLAVGNPREPQGAGAVELLSGRTGARLWIARSAIGGTQHGEWVSSFGDLDRDGVPDVLTTSVGLQSSPAVALSGKTGQTIRQYLNSWGQASEAGLVDLDAVPDLYCTTPSGVGLRSGASGQLLWSTSMTGGEAWPYRVGDLNGDGHADMLFRINGVVRAWSGRDGAPLWRFVGADWSGMEYHLTVLPRHQQRRGGGDPGLLRRSAQSLEPRQPRGAPRRPQRKTDHVPRKQPSQSGPRRRAVGLCRSKRCW